MAKPRLAPRCRKSKASLEWYPPSVDKTIAARHLWRGRGYALPKPDGPPLGIGPFTHKEFFDGRQTDDAGRYTQFC